MCFRPAWKFPADRRAGVDRRQEVVISSTGGDIRVGRQVAIDPDEVDRQLTYLSGLKQQLTAAATATAAAETKTEASPGSPPATIILDEEEDDVPMASASSRLVAAVSPVARPRPPPILVMNRFAPLFREASEAGNPES